MKYNKKLMYEIAEELHKIPNIRAVCKKVGIDHSTYYRWVSKHHEFAQLITATMVIAREIMNDAAEGVIIQGILRGDLTSAKYWLSHNDPLYASDEQIYYLKQLREGTMKRLDKKVPDLPYNSRFDSLFDFYHILENRYEEDPGRAREMIDPYVKFETQEDPELEEIFYTTYEEWKTNRWDLVSKELTMQWHHKENFGDTKRKKEKP